MTDFAAAAAQFIADQALFHAWLHGPASGGTSIVDFGGGLTVKTLARLAQEQVEAVGAPTINSGTSTLALDVSAYGAFTVANNHAVTTLSITGATAGRTSSFSLLLTADGTPRAWTWGASVTWINGEPTLTSTNAKRDLFSFFSFDGGTTWLAVVVAQGF